MCVGVCITETISQQPSDAPLSSTTTEDMSHDGPQPASVQPPIDATSIAPVDQRPIARVSPIMSPTAETTITTTTTTTTTHMQAESDDGPSAVMAVHTNLTSPLQSMTVD